MRSTDKVAKLAELYGPIRLKCSIHTSTERDVLGTEEIFNLEVPSAPTVEEVTQPNHAVKVKFCGISQEDTIPVLGETRPDHVGFVFAPSKRQVTIEQAHSIARKLQDSLQTTSGDTCISRVGVFVNETIPNVIEIAKKVPLSVVQLHGDEDISYIELLRNHLEEEQLGFIPSAR